MKIIDKLPGRGLAALNPEDALSTHADLNVAEIAERYATAWKSHDVDAILALTAEGSTFQAHGRTGQVQGQDDLRAEFTRIFERYPEFGAEEHRLLLGDRHWTLDWTLTFQPVGKDRRAIQALDVVEIDDAGKVTRKDTFFNFAHVKAALEAA